MNLPTIKPAPPAMLFSHTVFILIVNAGLQFSWDAFAVLHVGQRRFSWNDEVECGWNSHSCR